MERELLTGFAVLGRERLKHEAHVVAERALLQDRPREPS